MTGFLNITLAAILSPLLLGIIHRTKARWGGRRGAPLFQPYFDIIRLLQKGVVISETTTWIFFMSPIVGFTCTTMALALLPFGQAPSPLGFNGDLILFVYLLGLARFFIIGSALDTGSSFEGMGASREAQFSILSEIVLIVSLTALARSAGTLSVSGTLSFITPALWSRSGGMLALIAASLLVVVLVENARIPFDDPNTHLELTMIHEVMVLDHSGPDFALILYTSALKFWILGTLFVRVLLPTDTNLWLDQGITVVGLFGLAIGVGVIESAMARIRLVNVPQLLIGAGTLAVLALFLGAR